MGTTSPQQSPGLRGQTGVRTALRIGGVVLLAVALTFLVVGLADFFGSMDSFEGPHRFWMVFVGILLLGPAAWCLQAGFLGTAARFTAGETMPVVKDAAAYLSDGKGVFGVGRTDDDHADALTGPFCSKCGVRNDDGARFCDSCGAALVH
ncbi:MAG: zinc ribbon domain-containing protein [Nocardioides sp.]